MSRTNRGFTLIELLVVIAIIGILSSVVLASLTTARAKGQSAAVQSELANARAQAELYYSTNSNKYASTDGNTWASPGTSLLTNTAGNNGIYALLKDAEGKGATITAAASTTDWAAQALINSTYFCVDSTGKSTSSASTLITGGHC